MGQGALRRNKPRLNGYQQRKAKFELAQKKRRAEKLAKKGIITVHAMPLDKRAEGRRERYKEVAQTHKAIKKGGHSVKREKANMFTQEQKAGYTRRLSIKERWKIKEIRKWLIKHNGMVCQICGLPITKEEDCTIDHIVPKSQGGRTVRENCQLAHRMCNFLKDNEVSEEKLDN